MIIMLPSMDDLEFWHKYLMPDDTEKRTKKLKVKASDIPADDKERLLEYDDVFYALKGYHMIIDYEELI